MLLITATTCEAIVCQWRGNWILSTTVFQIKMFKYVIKESLVTQVKVLALTSEIIIIIITTTINQYQNHYHKRYCHYHCDFDHCHQSSSSKFLFLLSSLTDVISTIISHWYHLYHYRSNLSSLQSSKTSNIIFSHHQLLSSLSIFIFIAIMITN